MKHFDVIASSEFVNQTASLANQVVFTTQESGWYRVSLGFTPLNSDTQNGVQGQSVSVDVNVSGPSLPFSELLTQGYPSFPAYPFGQGNTIFIFLPAGTLIRFDVSIPPQITDALYNVAVVVEELS
jgi:hypothetical protein